MTKENYALWGDFFPNSVIAQNADGQELESQTAIPVIQVRFPVPIKSFLVD